MRTHFEFDESAEFEAAKDLLVRRCTAWARRQGTSLDPFVVSAALDFRHDSIDGRLGYWTVAQVRRFLLEWIPRKLSATADQLQDAPQDLHTLLRYLRDTDLDDPTGDPLPALEQAVAAAAREFPQAVSDERNFGPSKYWVMKALTAGIDPGDERVMQRFMERIEAGEISHDEAILDHIMRRHLADTSQPERALPVLPVSLPSETELGAIASKSRVVQQVKALTEWVGTGRPLTAKGHLKLADARELSERLDTDDLIDPVIGDRTFHTVSSAELRHLSVLVEWAKKIRLVRVVKNRLVPVAKSKPLLDDDLGLWLRAFDTVTDLTRVVFPPGRWRTNLLSDVFGVVLPDMLNAIYGMPAPIPVVRLDESVWDSCLHFFRISDADENRQAVWRRSVVHDFRRALALLADLGAVELSTGHADPLYSLDVDDIQGPTELPIDVQDRIRTALQKETELVVLTPLGTSAVRTRLIHDGRHAPLVGDLTWASAAQLLGVIAEHYTPDTGREEIDRWLAVHGPQGLDALLQGVRGCAFRTRAAAMLDVLLAARPDRELILRRLRTDPALGPLVVVHLVTAGKLAMDQVSPAEGILTMTEQLLHLLELGGPEAVRGQLGAVPNVPEMADTVANSGHSDSEGLEELRTLVFEPELHRAHRTLRAMDGTRRSTPRKQVRSKKKRKR